MYLRSLLARGPACSSLAPCQPHFPLFAPACWWQPKLSSRAAWVTENGLVQLVSRKLHKAGVGLHSPGLSDESGPVFEPDHSTSGPWLGVGINMRPGAGVPLPCP